MHDPRVPETLEGWSILHQMFRVRFGDLRELGAGAAGEIGEEAARALQAMGGGGDGTTAPVTILGHKGDLMLVHFRRTFDELQAAQLAVAPASPRCMPARAWAASAATALRSASGRARQSAQRTRNI